MQFGLPPYNVIYTTLIVTWNLQGRAILFVLYTKEIKDIETYSVSISYIERSRRVDLFNLISLILLHISQCSGHPL